MLILGIFSTALAKKFVGYPKKGWDEPVNIYNIIALPSGNNKSAALRKVIQPLKNWEKEKCLAYAEKRKKEIFRKKTLEKIIDEKCREISKDKNHNKRAELIAEIENLEAQLPQIKVLPQLFVTDATAESLTSTVAAQNGKMSIISDEGGIFEVLSGLYSKGQANIGIILKRN